MDTNKLYLQNKDPHSVEPCDRYIDLSKLEYSDNPYGEFIYLQVPLIIEDEEGKIKRIEHKKMYSKNNTQIKRDVTTGKFVDIWVVKEDKLPKWSGDKLRFEEDDYLLVNGDKVVNNKYNEVENTIGEYDYFQNITLNGKYKEFKKTTIGNILLSLEPTGRYDIKGGK